MFREIINHYSDLCVKPYTMDGTDARWRIRTDGRTDSQVDGQTNGQTKGRTKTVGQTKRLTVERMERRKGGRTVSEGH